MFNQISVLIPYKKDNGVRDQLFYWVIQFYKNAMPDVELCIGESNSEPFNRSEAVNLASKKATRDIFAIADGDVIYDPAILIKSIEMLNQHAWIVPYSKWLNISKASTEELLKSKPQWPLSKKVEYRDRFANKYHKPVSGVIIVPRNNFEKVNGFDEGFKGWGKEDIAFRDALNTICGPYQRFEEHFIYHLWHPTEGSKGNPHFTENEALYKEYAKRNGKQQEMKEFIEGRKR